MKQGHRYPCFLSLFNHSGNLKHYLGFRVRIWEIMAYIRDVPSLQRRVHMKKYQLVFKISAVLSYLFFVFGLSQLTLIVQNYWQFSSQIGNFFWIQNILSLLFSGVMIWILVKTGHGYLFRIPRKNGFGIRF